MAKKFFYLCAGVLMLALAFHFGSTSARAQAPGNPVVAAWNEGSLGGLVFFAMTSNGDLYMGQGSTWSFQSNVFAGSGPTPAQRESWGAVKQRYR